PGVALAISDPRHRWRLLEPRRKRAAFLEEVARELSLDYEVVRMRAEEAARDPRYAHKHGLVTARAVAPPAVAFRLTRPLVARGGIACVFVGRGDALPEGAEAAGSGLAIIRG
ncbi:MAG TPA: RsmG family class I SAM-dependent methyltransferase, partial [Actinomycetota bacterium]|nr:RsmG family class I SAM-dependent methyltransferase [Actinomycetota bacterium]